MVGRGRGARSTGGGGLDVFLPGQRIGPSADLADDLTHPDGDQAEVDDPERRERGDELAGTQRRHRVIHQELAVDQPRLPPGLRHHPAADRRDHPDRQHPQHQPQEPAFGVQAAPQPHDDADEGDGEHRPGPVNHEPETPEHQRDGRLQVRWDRLQARNGFVAGEVVKVEHALGIGQADLDVVTLLCLVGDGEHVPARVAVIEIALGRDQLVRLVDLRHVGGHVVPHVELDRQQYRRRRQADRQRLPGERQGPAPQQVVRADGGDEPRRGDQHGQDHVREAPVEGRVEDRVEPVDRLELAVDLAVAGRGLHPRVRRRRSRPSTAAPPGPPGRWRPSSPACSPGPPRTAGCR